MKAETPIFEDHCYYKKAPLFRGHLPPGAFVQIVEIPPNATVPPHYHLKQYEFFYVIDGNAILGIGTTEYDAKKGDMFLVKPKTIHWVKNDKTTFKLLVIKFNFPENQNDTVWISPTI